MALAALAGGCVAPTAALEPTADATLIVDAGVDALPLLAYGPPITLAPEAVFETPGPEDVGFVAPLPTEGVTFTLGRLLEWLDAGAEAPHQLGADVGKVHAVLAIGQGASAQVLVGGEHGLFSVVATILERSPLGGALAGQPVLALLDTGTPEAPEVWIVTPDALRLWRGGMLQVVRLSTRPAGGAAMPVDPSVARFAACRAGEGGQGRLIVLPAPSSGLLLSLEAADVDPRSGGTVPVETRVVGHPVSLLACDGRGVVVAATADRLLVEIDRDGALSAGVLPEPLHTLVADPATSGVWMGAAGKVLYGRALALQEVTADWGPYLGDDAGSKERGTPALVADLGGPVLLAGPRRIGRLRPQIALELHGLPPAPTVVDAPLTLDVSAPFPALLRALVAELDGTPQWSDLATRRVALNPWSVPEGPHTLTVTATYADGPPLAAKVQVTLRRPLSPPGWLRDVAPIYSARCRACHGPNGSGHLMDTAARWQAESRTILSAVGERRMPLPPNAPLSGVEIAVLSGWSVTGFSP